MAARWALPLSAGCDDGFRRALKHAPKGAQMRLERVERDKRGAVRNAREAPLDRTHLFLNISGPRARRSALQGPEALERVAGWPEVFSRSGGRERGYSGQFRDVKGLALRP